MKRRTFLQSSIGVTAALGTTTSFAQQKPNSAEWYELRTYSLKPEKQPLLDEYLKHAFIPAAKRITGGPVGVFVEKAADNVRLLVLTVHPSAESCVLLSSRLAADAEYQKAAADFLAVRAGDPIYLRIESSVMAAMEGMPKLVVPDIKQSRMLNLRVYESHNERAGKKKIEMFNKGEIAIFQRVGLTLSFFAETVIGSAMPNLTYLLVFPDDAARNSAWDRFRSDKEWLQLKSIPEYADKEIVLRVTNRLMTPADYSEI